MLHLYPVKIVLSICFILAGLSVMGLVYLGLIGVGHPVSEVWALIKWSTCIAGGMPIVLYFIWRKSLRAQNAIFPYLGGEWKGQLRFSGRGRAGTRKVTLQVRHTLVSLQLILDSTESTSHTLVVQAQHDQKSMLKRLYYIYRNVRKEGHEGAGDNYRGLAIMEIAGRSRTKLHGTYFTERGGKGTLSLSLKTANPLWAFWR